ncbi:hypothetical protein [Polynucleobacter sp. UK-Kesae-W10]|uniref:hypothetical protein n=1 Tax=Polynucleobacter sp. UK-Kesae-W10 TaxID=1819738 RepID=UPI001C0B2CDE|nr:hypothetical protein [Polynucleobacter sp. UK-Kesae-W10]MBU3577726.1 hypothetical protein [Polynucleobacter sp. UK-Kesae-W10]
MKSCKYVPMILSALILCACGSPMTPDFGQMSAKYANTLEQYQINMIFQNILRASENRPVSFLDMPTINGSGSIGVSSSVGALFTGGAIPYNASYNVIQGGLSYATPSTSLNLNNNFNFTQSSLDNAVFWKGYLNELPVETVKYFEHNHIPKEVALTIVIDQIQVIHPNGSQETFINNPLRPDYAQFQKHLYELIADGFEAALIDTSQKIGPPTTIDHLRPKFGEKGLEFLKESGIALQKVDGPQPYLFQPVQVSKQYKLCVQKNKYENYVAQQYFPGIYCQETLAEQISKQNPAKKNQPKLLVRIRSTNNIFEFLGQVVKAQLAQQPFLLKLPPTPTTFNDNRSEINKYALLVVNKDKPTQKPFSIIESLDGFTYSIPSEENGYSPLTIKLLSQLMSLQKIPGSIPASPSVLLK